MIVRASRALLFESFAAELERQAAAPVYRSLDGHLWSRHFRRVVLRQLQTVCQATSDRLLPTFDSREEEADCIASEGLERLGRMPGDDSADMAGDARRVAG